jgi:hypothetical protein
VIAAHERAANRRLTLVSSRSSTLRPVMAAKQVPVVDYLVLGDGPPHLVGNRCDGCRATYLERRNACAACGQTSWAGL